MCNHPPGFHDKPAEAGNVTSLAMNSPFSLAASSSLAASVSSLSAGTGLFNHAGGFRGAQPRIATRAQEVAAMLDETLGCYVKATGKDESLMRGQFTRMKLESLRKERDHWRTRAEAKQRLQDKRSSSGSTSRKRKSTHLSVLLVQMKSLCKRGWQICSKSLWHKTERKPERGRAWSRRVPTPKDVKHGRRYGIRNSSPCHRFLRKETEPRRQTGRRARRTGLFSGENLMLGNQKLLRKHRRELTKVLGPDV